MQFPDGYDTYIEQGGTNVSGGQKQRLCIARALLKKPKILILDDSISAVDTKTDAKIRKAMWEYIPETTKIIIAQRTASVEDADRIIVMDGGRINAIGNHEELLNGNDIYREIYPVIMPVTILCIVFSAIVSAVPTIFMQKIIAVIEDNWEAGEWRAISKEITTLVVVLAGADDFITRLPESYQTLLTGNGANLSQGQRQLISIARAAVADPPVMILDEATSSIDTRTEAIVQRGMDALMEGRTVFVIAHRLSTVKNSNAIIVLDHGRIIERGNHDDLIAQKGQYYQLYTGAFELE